MFQPLIGRLQTRDGDGVVVEMPMFQPLIGRLQTPYLAAVIWTVSSGFQPLIGRLQTKRDGDGVVVEMPTFQPLIGRLQTFVDESVDELEPEVSTPHR